MAGFGTGLDDADVDELGITPEVRVVFGVRAIVTNCVDICVMANMSSPAAARAEISLCTGTCDAWIELKALFPFAFIEAVQDWE